MSERAAVVGEPTRVRLRRTAGWRIPADTVKIDRSTKWGNPYLASELGNAEAVRRLQQDLERTGVFMSPKLGRAVTVDEIRQGLRGKNLACWCKEDEPCHADVLLTVANGA